MALILPQHRLEEIPETIFAELRKGTVQKKHPFRNVVFSTVDEKHPKSRWVVFRKLTENQRFLIFTDLRSNKTEEIRNNSSCSLLFYNNRQGLQIRVEGVALLHSQDDLTNKYWVGVQGNGLKSYSTVLPPGSSIAKKDEGNQWLDEPTSRYFTVLEIIPNYIDVLQLGRESHIRAEFKRIGNDWTGTYVVP